MRLIFCSLLLLCGCSASAVRCDAHLQPINPPAANGPASGTAIGTASGTAKATTVRRTP
jgi:hypothetical protein